MRKLKSIQLYYCTGMRHKKEQRNKEKTQKQTQREKSHVDTFMSFH